LQKPKLKLIWVLSNLKKALEKYEIGAAMSKDHLPFAEKSAYLLLCLLLLAGRFLHFGPEIDEPHGWRQCDTAFYLQDFARNGVDLLHPSVCWMGPHRTVILEFPLPEALAALPYRWSGEDMRWARLVFLLLFTLSAFYFFRILSHLFSQRTAYLALLVYLGLPLSLFYSRALHIDFSALALGFAGIYYLLQGLEKPGWRPFLASSLLLSLAFLIKAPALLPLGLPLLWLVWERKAFRSLLPYLPLLLLPLLAFFFWRKHVEAVNAMAPDWSFIPGYYQLVDMGKWYFSTWEQRMDPYAWKVLGERFSLELAGLSGILLGISGLFFAGRRTIFMLLWLLGLLLYLFLFFGLNFIHDYYQIPFVPFLALGIALSLQALARRKLLWLAWLLLLLVLAENFWRSEYGKYPYNDRYYRVKELYVTAGNITEQATQPGDQLILSDPFQDPRSPFWMYRTGRTGWPIDLDRLTPEIIERLQAEGASQLVIMSGEAWPPALQGWLEGRESQQFTIDRADGSRWRLWVLKLN
jgi:hypothetical protein